MSPNLHFFNQSSAKKLQKHSIFSTFQPIKLLDVQKVIGSNPIEPTIKTNYKIANQKIYFSFIFQKIHVDDFKKNILPI
jgi:hypothetical protein